VPRPERRVALEELEGQDPILVEQDLVARAEELELPGIGGADVAADGDPAELEQAVADGRDREEILLPEDRVVTLDDVLVVRVPPVAPGVRVVLDRTLVAIPVGEPETPPVGDRHEVRARRRRIWM